jgi:hypothetical protein
MSIVDNCIVVAEHAELVLKNCPSRTVKDSNGRVKDGEKREIFVVPSSCGNSTNNYLQQTKKVTIICELKFFGGWFTPTY